MSAAETGGSPRRRVWPWATAILIGAAAAVYGWPAIAPALLYDRDLVWRGEVWRLVTGHWVHFGASHLVWNAVVLIVAGGWCECIQPARTRWLYVFAPVAIGVALLAFDRDLERYAGLSGVATSVVVLLALTQLRERRDQGLWVAMLVAVAVKIAFEAGHGATIFAQFSPPDIRSVALAHFAGAIAAVLVHCVRR